MQCRRIEDGDCVGLIGEGGWVLPDHNVLPWVVDNPMTLVMESGGIEWIEMIGYSSFLRGTVK